MNAAPLKTTTSTGAVESLMVKVKSVRPSLMAKRGIYLVLFEIDGHPSTTVSAFLSVIDNNTTNPGAPGNSGGGNGGTVGDGGIVGDKGYIIHANHKQITESEARVLLGFTTNSVQIRTQNEALHAKLIDLLEAEAHVLDRTLDPPVTTQTAIVVSDITPAFSHRVGTYTVTLAIDEAQHINIQAKLTVEKDKVDTRATAVSNGTKQTSPNTGEQPWTALPLVAMLLILGALVYRRRAGDTVTATEQS